MRADQWKSRHTVLAILFATSMLSFLDRIAMSVAVPFIADEYRLSALQSGMLLSAFFAGYTIMQIPGGLLADRFGVRRVATGALMIWSIFTALTGVVTNILHLGAVRFLFGLGEGVFPACAFKTVAMWFPKEERPTANAIRLASGPVGAALAPLFVTAVISIWGWRHVFLFLLVPGLILAAIFWIFVRDEPPRNMAVEQGAETQGDKPGFLTSLGYFLRDPNLVKYAITLFLFDVALWGFTTWLPTFLLKSRGFSMVEMGFAASLPFVAGAVGAAMGGAVGNWAPFGRQKLPLFLIQLVCIILLYGMFATSSGWLLVVLQTFAGFFLNMFITAFWAMPMRTVPGHVMGFAGGFINTGGQLAAFVSPICMGYLIDRSGGDFQTAFLFLCASILASVILVAITKYDRKVTVDRAYP